MQDVKKKLDDLPKIKVHCSTMAVQALRKAIKNYKEKTIKENKINGK
jgi:NifU-like protein involved in Fe-S cluster formation